MKIPVFLLLILAGSMLFSQTPVPQEPDESYFINSEPVTREKFEAFLKTLQEIPKTWYCAETTDGGITGYDARDSAWVIYKCRFESKAGTSKSTIQFIKNDSLD